MQEDLDPIMVAAVEEYLTRPDTKRRHDSSATWTTSSGDASGFSSTDEVDDRVHFVDEYNRLAKKHGIRLLVKEDLNTCPDADRTVSHERRSSWFRALLREFSGSSHGSGVGTRQPSSSARAIRKVSSKRSLSDFATHLIHHKKDAFKDEDLQTLVRLCGKSMFYLPTEYASASLVLPTCFRATAQYLVQYGTETRGIFRIPGSPKVVNAIYDHYCPTRDDAEKIDTTVSSPNLPAHFKARVHDVATTFKKFLTGLPGGILGSLALFDAFVAIYSQVYADAEINRTKQSKLRARMVALAIGTLKSQYRRELICAVFGLLSLIGRKAELAPREDGAGRPLPTSDLMGYRELGNVFGPLMAGDLLDSYSMRLASPREGLVLLPASPPKPRARRRQSGRRQGSDGAGEYHSHVEVDKVDVAKDIAEMVITHWREVVKHLKSLQVLRTHKEITDTEQSQLHMKTLLRPSASETFGLRQPAGWKQSRTPSFRTDSMIPRQVSFSSLQPTDSAAEDVHEPLKVKRKRPKSTHATAKSCGAETAPVTCLSPMVEETGSPLQQVVEPVAVMPHDKSTPVDRGQESSTPKIQYGIILQSTPCQSPSVPRKSICRKKMPGDGSMRTQKGPRGRRDTPAPTQRKHDLEQAWERTRALDITDHGQGPEDGVQGQVLNNRPDEAVDVDDQPSDAHCGPSRRDSMKVSPIPPASGLLDAQEHDVQALNDDTNRYTPPKSFDWNHEQNLSHGEVEQQKQQHGTILPPETPVARPKDFSGTPAVPDLLPEYSKPDVYPGAFPESPMKESIPQLGESVQQEVHAPGHEPAATSRFSKRLRDEASAHPKSKAPELTEPGKPNTISHSVRTTLDQASNTLRSGLSSAASALVEAFKPPSSTDMSPTRFPGPQGSLRRIARPSRHRRLNKRSSDAEISVARTHDRERMEALVGSGGDTAQTGLGPGKTRGRPEASPLAVSGNDRASPKGQKDVEMPTTNGKQVSVGCHEKPAADPIRVREPGVDITNKEAAAAQPYYASENPGSGSPAFPGGVGDILAGFSNLRRDLGALGSQLTRGGPGGAGRQESAGHPAGSYFPSNDGNQSSSFDTTREKASYYPVSEMNEKARQDEVDRFSRMIKAHRRATMTDDTHLKTAHDDPATEKPLGTIETPSVSENRIAEGHSSNELGQSGSDSDKTPHHFFDSRPQRSVRRLSHIFKGMRRPSTSTVTPPLTQYTSTPTLRGPHRRSSTSFTSQTPQSQAADPMILGPGRMTPYQELPPVASHLHHRLQPRSATPSMETMPFVATPGHGSNAALYKQVLTLQRQLAARTEEAAQLRRQLEAVGESENAATLSERLRLAERDVTMWRNRALAAERRVVVFERFLARVRRLREKRGDVGEDVEEDAQQAGQGKEGIEADIEREMKAFWDGNMGQEGAGQFDGADGLGDRLLLTAAREALEYEEERTWMAG